MSILDEAPVPSELDEETLSAPPRRTLAIPRRARRRRSLRLSPATLKTLLYAAIMLVLFGVGYVVVTVPGRLIQNGAQYAGSVAKLTQAEQSEQQALAQSDPLVRRHLLDEANQLAAQAFAEHPSSTAFATATARIGREYQDAAGTAPLPTPDRVVDLAAPSDQMVLHDGSLYVLDRTNSRISLYMLNAEGTAPQDTPNPILVRSGDHIGPVTVGKLTQIAWMPAGGARKTAAMMALDSDGWLIQHEPVGGISYVALANQASWADVVGIAGDAGNLFALSAAHQSLVWLPPQPTGYDGPMYNYVEPTTTVALGDATALAVNGDLILSHASGQIQSFRDGKANPFAGPPNDMLPANPVGLAVGANSIFVGDPGRGRIVQLSRQGDYQRALIDGNGPSVLASLRDIALSDDGKALYVLAGSTVYRFVLPDL